VDLSDALYDKHSPRLRPGEKFDQGTGMKITDIECHVIVVPEVNADACSSAQDDVVVLVHTDAGITGVGETDTNPWATRAYVEAPSTHIMALGLREMLIGADPTQPVALWDKLYTGSIMTGRRGLGICAMGAIDMALWDICGQAAGKPVWQLLGGQRTDPIVPYASLLPSGHTLRDYQDGLVDQVTEAKSRGFRAAKLEVCLSGPWSHNRLQEPDAAFVETVARCREAVGPEMTLMVDVVYAFEDRKRALNVINGLEPYDIYFVETPLRVDDLEGHGWLADHTSVRIASGEWLQTRFEFRDLIDIGKVDVAQPSRTAGRPASASPPPPTSPPPRRIARSSSTCPPNCPTPPSAATSPTTVYRWSTARSNCPPSPGWGSSSIPMRSRNTARREVTIP
jgi:L-alanine-DL-glutamate epimerase-like enolase superfamily enzyme